MKRGFSLVELMVVVAMVSILLAVLIPNLRKAKEDRKMEEHPCVKVCGFGNVLEFKRHDECKCKGAQ